MRTDPSLLSQYYRPHRGTYRSANLLLDFGKPHTLQSYLPTRKSVTVLDTILEALQEGHTDRALSLIAPYGSGKSSLLVVLGTILANYARAQQAIHKVLARVAQLSPSSAATIRKRLRGRRRYVVVLLSGYEGSAESAFVNGLKAAFERQGLVRVWKDLTRAFPALTGDRERPLRAGSVLRLYQKALEAAREANYLGIVVLYDEFGKVFEAQQAEPQPKDLLFIQNFAELSSRSSTAQLHLIVALHQGFSQYAHRLPIYLRNEWAKIEGRFRVIHFVEDSLQVYELIAQTLRHLHISKTSRLAPRIKKLARVYAEEAGRVPGLAEIESQSARVRLTERAYPLHPLALYVLPRLSARVAQNERTLFHFLLGQETSCLYGLLQQRQVSGQKFPMVGIADLYEYFAELMMKDTGVGGTYRRYIEIRTALDRTKPDETLARAIIKTIGILSVVGETSKIPPTEDVLHYAFGAFESKVREEINTALQDLVERRILLYRRHNREYRIWEGSDVDTLSLIRQKKAELEKTLDTVQYLGTKVPPAPILAYRYNEDFAITRYFESEYLSLPDLERLASPWDKSLGKTVHNDGTAYYVPCMTEHEIDRTLHLTKSIQDRQLLFAIPRKPLTLADPLLELHCLEQLLGDSNFLGQDPVLQREISELADDCLRMVRRVMGHFLDPRYGETFWVHEGHIHQDIDSQAKLRRLISDICREVFPLTPKFNNELINRHQPSAVIVNARKKLVRAMLEQAGLPNLGLTGFGPDVSMFRAILLRPGLYQGDESKRHRFVTAHSIDDENVKQTVKTIEDFFGETTETPKSFRTLVERLLAPPFGIRPGVMPILLAAAFKASPTPLNLMDEGVYVKELKPDLFEKMLQLPDRVTVQSMPLAGEVRDYLEAIAKIFPAAWDPLRQDSPDPVRQLLDVMYRWFHGLPPCATKTNRLKPQTILLRNLLLQAIDPVALIAREIPGLFAEHGEAVTPPSSWLDDVRQSVNELARVKEAFVQEVGRLIHRTFAIPDGQSLVESLSQGMEVRSADLSHYLDDPQCEGFLTRIQSRYSTDEALIESVASLVTGRSISHWDDSFLRQFELGILRIHDKLEETDVLLRGRLREEVGEQVSWDVRVTAPGKGKRRFMLRDEPLSLAARELRDALSRIILETEGLSSEERQRVLIDILANVPDTDGGVDEPR